jgi:hypothetical protein
LPATADTVEAAPASEVKVTPTERLPLQPIE